MDELFGGRTPTTHERISGQPWDASYQDGPAPWDFGGPQPAIVSVAAKGGFHGTVLDAGCGTGENALHLAALGRSVLGVDVAETALAIARHHADERELEVEFMPADALNLARLGRTFDTVLDSGLFHAFDAAEQRKYAESLANVTAPGATLYVLCFADEGQDQGPHPVSKQDLKDAFAAWQIEEIKPERIRTRFHDEQGVRRGCRESSEGDPRRPKAQNDYRLTSGGEAEAGVRPIILVM